MSETIRIALDAMGGDNGVAPNVEGAVTAVNANPSRIVLVGDENEIHAELKNFTYPENSIEVVHAEEAVGMGESPRQAIENKPDSSILVAARLVATGKADALVSAGSTGSVVLAAAKEIPRINGVRRTAIATVYPTMNALGREDILSLMVDVGANVECNAEELVQFAIMGASYVSDIRDIENPRVSLLNIGEESTKGGNKMKMTYKLLESNPDINFSGNIEGKDLLKGITDVVVTEGFVGNIVIKTLEGAAHTLMSLGKIAYKKKLSWKLGLMMLRKGLNIIKEVTDYSEYGGAPLLGFEKMIIIAHGRSNSKAISNAIKLAGKSVRDDVCDVISKRIKEFEIEPHREYDRMSSEII